MNKFPVYTKIPQADLEIYSFQEHLTGQMRILHEDLIQKITSSFGNIELGRTDSQGIQEVLLYGETLGYISFKYGYNGPDCINNQITAGWEFKQTVPVNES